MSPLSFDVLEMITEEQVRKLAEEKIAESGNFIVEIKVKPGNRITILLDNDKGVSIADCVALSRHVEFSLDRETEDFELQVSSPGLDQPLKTIRQYRKYVGKQVDVVTKENKKLTGKLLDVTEEGITIESRTKEKTETNKGKQIIINNIHLTYNQIKETKIVISF